MESLGSCKPVPEASCSYTAELVTGVKNSALFLVPAQESEPCSSGVIVLAHCDVLETQVAQMETEPCSSGVMVLLHRDLRVDRTTQNM